MKQVTPEFKKNVDAFMDANKDFFADMQASYQEAIVQLSTLLSQDMEVATLEEVVSIENETLHGALIELGQYMVALKKATKRKVIAEYICLQKEYSIHVCRLAEQAEQFFDIKDRIANSSRLLQLIKEYKTAEPTPAVKREIYQSIHSYQYNFNKNHLKRFSLLLFGMTYKELVTIQEDCYSQTFATYSGLSITKEEGLVYQNKDGSKAE